MKKIGRSVFCMVFLTALHVAASAPKEAASESKPTASEGKKSTAFVTPQSFLGDQIMKFFQKKQEEGKQKKPEAGGQQKAEQGKKAALTQPQGGQGETAKFETTTEEKPINTYVMPKVSVTPTYKVYKPVPVYGRAITSVRGVTRIHTVAVPPPQARVPASVKINQVVRNLVSMNEQIKRLKEKEAAELEKAQGQELVHRTILDEQEKGLKGAEPGQKKPEEKALLAQEKLREIHDKTQLNAQMTSELKDIPDAEAPQSEKKS